MRTPTLLSIVLVAAGCVGGQPLDVAADDYAATAVLQGVDRAGAFSPSEAKSLKSAYGIGFTGVYIGGPCSAGSGWSAASVTAIYDAVQWQFLPIFVGQQSAAICGRSTLTEAQGITDGKQAMSDMAAFKWAAGYHFPVALDLEAGSYDADPAGAVAYTKGFADTVSAGGYDVYVYSSVTALNALASAKIPTIAAAWPAYWLTTNGGFKSGLSPSQVPGLSSVWTSKPGGWQYNSGPSVVGGVDYDVANFPLAPAPGQTPPVAVMAGHPSDGGTHGDGGTMHDGGGGGGGATGDVDMAGGGGGSGGGDDAGALGGSDGGHGPILPQHGCAIAGAPSAASGELAFVALFLFGVGRSLRRARRR